MKKLLRSKLFLNLFAFVVLLSAVFVLFGSTSVQANHGAPPNMPICEDVQVGNIGFKIPSFSDILTFAIRLFFTIAGLAALFYMLLGAFAWVTSGGDKDAITAARDKIVAALVGVILIIVVLAIIWTLENIIFQRKICVGLTCPVTIPGLLKPGTGTGPTQECWCENQHKIINYGGGDTCT